MSGSVLEALKRLSRPRDRLPTPFLVRREAVIADIEAQLAEAPTCVRADAPVSGLTMLVHGGVFREERQRNREVNAGLALILGAKGSAATTTAPPPVRFESLAGKNWPRPRCV